MIINEITASDINSWAQTQPLRARETFPKLISKLILATSPNIETFNFQFEDGIQYPGYDGVLECKEKTDFVPSGKSVWEFGTDADQLSKFRKDYKKRSENPLGVDTDNTVFIFATPRIWHHATPMEQVINESKSLHRWKDVRIIDAQTTALWIEECPSVAVWFSKIIGKHISGLISIEDYWEDRALTTEPVLTTNFFLVERESQSEELIEWIRVPKGYLLLIAESSLEANLFAISVLLNLETIEGQMLQSRTMIIENQSAWEDIITKNIQGVLLIPVFECPLSMRYPLSIAAILPVSRYAPIARTSDKGKYIELQKYRKSQFQKALELQGFDINEISRREVQTKRSFLTFYRQITNVPMRRLPIWAHSENIRSIIPAMLIGGWDAEKQGDLRIIETISGMDRTKYLQSLQCWTHMEDAPIIKVFEKYQIVSVLDMWNYLFHYVSKENIDHLKICIGQVFEVEDPALDLPEEERYMAAVLGKKPMFSQSLIEGLCITLIMLKEREGEENSFGAASIKYLVNDTVYQILDHVVTWKQWSTIINSLGLLAEAAPQVVIERIEKEISKDDSEIWELFRISKDVFWGRNYYTHLLWTLEQLAWDQEASVRAIMALAAIGEKRFEYKMANTPENSLYEIFCLWHPQSCNNTQERSALVRTIVKRYPITGWKLIDSLLPSTHAVCGNISRPRWQRIAGALESEFSRQEYNISLHDLVQLCIDEVGNVKEQWLVIVRNTKSFIKHLDTLTIKFMEISSEMDGNDILEIMAALREQVFRFRKFRGNLWSIDEEYVIKIENWLNSIQSDSIMQFRYAFEYQPHVLNPTPYDKNEKYNHQEEREKIFVLRRHVTAEALSMYGVEPFLAFCSQLKDTSDLGKILASILLNYEYDFSYLKKIENSSKDLYSSILWELNSHHGISELVNVLNKADRLSDDEVGFILCHTPLCKEVWDEVDKYEEATKRYYWEHVKVYRLMNSEEDQTDYFIKMLLQYDRPYSAIGLISYTNYNSAQRITEILQKSIECHDKKENDGSSIRTVDSSAIMDLFNKLYDDISIEEQTVIELEMAFLAYFRNEGKPKRILGHLEKSPEEYATLISLVHAHDEDSVENNELDSLELSHRRKIREVLEYFTQIPGCNHTDIDKSKFDNWIHRVMVKACAGGYRIATEMCIGELLSYSPVGTDGIFPHEFVREFLEFNSTREMEDNFVSGKRNQRGVHPVTGGKEEREIAKCYKANAQIIRVMYPKTAALLRRLSDSFEYESMFEETRAMSDFY